MQALVREAVSQDQAAVDRAALAAEVRLFGPLRWPGPARPPPARVR